MGGKLPSGIVPGGGEPIIDPYPVSPIGSVPRRLPTSRVLLAITPRLFRVAALMADEVEEVECPAIVVKCLVGRYGDVDILVALPYWGAPASVVGLEDLIAAGASEVVVLGVAGAIHPKARIGGILVPTWGIREEGTSYHYMEASYVPRPSRCLARRLVEALWEVKGRRRHRILCGGIWTTDAMYRETRDKVEGYSRLGAYGVDMEMTALYTVAHYRGIHLAGAVAISDELYGESWKPGFNSRKLKRAEKIVVAAGIKALASKRGSYSSPR